MHCVNLLRHASLQNLKGYFCTIMRSNQPKDASAMHNTISCFLMLILEQCSFDDTRAKPSGNSS